MMKKELIKRWETEEGEKKLSQILVCLNKNKPLSTIQDLEKHNGRWDLRGSKLSILSKESNIEYKGYKFNQKTGTLKLQNADIVSVDFTYADISYSRWEKCSVTDCVFDSVKAIYTDIYACDFTNCIFTDSNLSHSNININIASNSGSFKDTSFNNCNLSKTVFAFPTIENCAFANCKMNETDFDGSRFKDTKFIGLIKSGWFRKYSIHAHKSFMWIFNKVDLLKYPNEMYNVDFSECELDDVQFLDGINLKQCIYPKEDKYLIIKNVSNVYTLLRKKINTEWTENEKHIAIFWIDNLYFNKGKCNMPIDIINKECITNAFPKKLYDSFFNELEIVNNYISKT